MKITVKACREGKVHILIDGEYKLTVDSEYWYTSPWHSLKEINEQELEELSVEIEKRRAFNNGVSLAMGRLHSKKELYTKLCRKYSKEASRYACNKCEEIGIVNDADFACLYARELFERKNMGLSRIRIELKRKGISNDIIEDAVENIDFDDNAKLKELIEKKYQRYLGDKKGKEKTVRALLRLGYGYSDITNALKEFTEIEDFSEE